MQKEPTANAGKSHPRPFFAVSGQGVRIGNINVIKWGQEALKPAPARSNELEPTPQSPAIPINERNAAMHEPSDEELSSTKSSPEASFPSDIVGDYPLQALSSKGNVSDEEEKTSDEEPPSQPASPPSQAASVQPRMISKVEANFWREKTGSPILSATGKMLDSIVEEAEEQVGVLLLRTADDCVNSAAISNVAEANDEAIKQFISDKFNNTRSPTFSDMTLEEVKQITKPLFDIHRLWKTKEKLLGIAGSIRTFLLGAVRKNLSPQQQRALFEMLLLYNFSIYPPTQESFEFAATEAARDNYEPAKEWILGEMLDAVFEYVPISDNEAKSFYTTLYFTPVYEQINELENSVKDRGTFNQIAALTTVITSICEERHFFEE